MMQVLCPGHTTLDLPFAAFVVLMARLLSYLGRPFFHDGTDFGVALAGCHCDSCEGAE
jgi:hypothetical protein